jgi:hypothetical protein
MKRREGVFSPKAQKTVCMQNFMHRKELNHKKIVTKFYTCHIPNIFTIVFNLP